MAMDKQKFIEEYINRPDKIRVIFHVGAFLQNLSIIYSEERIGIDKVLKFYVPKYSKNGSLDERRIEDQINDPAVVPLRVEDAVSDPSAWGLDASDELVDNIAELNPIPVATDLSSGRTLLLDSNHTIVNILKNLSQDSFASQSISIVRITGEGLEDVIEDFKILNRKQ